MCDSRLTRFCCCCCSIYCAEFKKFDAAEKFPYESQANPTQCAKAMTAGKERKRVTRVPMIGQNDMVSHSHIDPIKLCGEGGKRRLEPTRFDLGRAVKLKRSNGQKIENAGVCIPSVDMGQSKWGDKDGPKNRKKDFGWLPWRLRRSIADIGCEGSCLGKNGQCRPGCYDGTRFKFMANSVTYADFKQALNSVLGVLQQVQWIACSAVPPQGCKWTRVPYQLISKEKDPKTGLPQVTWADGFDPKKMSSDPIRNRQQQLSLHFRLPCKGPHCDSTTWKRRCRGRLNRLTPASPKEVYKSGACKFGSMDATDYKQPLMCPREITLASITDKAQHETLARRRRYVYTKMTGQDQEIAVGLMTWKQIDQIVPGHVSNLQKAGGFWSPHSSLGESAGKSRRRRRNILLRKAKNSVSAVRKKGVVGAVASGGAAASAANVAVKQLKKKFRRKLEDFVDNKIPKWLEALKPFLKFKIIPLAFSFETMQGAPKAIQTALSVIMNDIAAFGDGNMLNIMRYSIPRAVIAIGMSGSFNQRRTELDPSYRPPMFYQGICGTTEKFISEAAYLPNSRKQVVTVTTREMFAAAHDKSAPANVSYVSRPMPEWGEFYVVRASRGYLDASMCDKRPISQKQSAAVFLTCLHEALAELESGKASTSDRDQYVREKCHCYRTNDGKPVANAKKKNTKSCQGFGGPRTQSLVPEQRVGLKYEPKSNEPFVYQGCVTELKFRMNRCTTCCCKGGLVVADIRHRLVFGAQSLCGNFFTIIDALARLVVAAWRGAMTVIFYGDRCFSNATKLAHQPFYGDGKH